MFDIGKTDILRLKKEKVIDGNLLDSGTVYFDKTILPLNITSPIILEEDNNLYVADKSFNEIVDGQWLISIDGKYSIRTVSRIPNNNIRVTKSEITFDCPIDDLHFTAIIKNPLYDKKGINNDTRNLLACRYSIKICFMAFPVNFNYCFISQTNKRIFKHIKFRKKKLI